MAKIGRPTVYSAAILTKSRAYLKACEDEIEEFHKTRGEKSDSYDRLVRVKLPTIDGLAVVLGVRRETLYAWEQEPEKQEFSNILAELRAMQADRLINHGLSGDYNPTIAKVLLTKHGYREGLEHTGADGGDLFTDEHKKKAKEALDQLAEGDTG